jgi:sodium transport system ATP-binding protein
VIAERSTRLAAALDMQDFLERRAKAIHRDSARRPRSPARSSTSRATVVLDEPTNGLDVMTTRSLRPLPARLARRRPLHPVLEPRHAGGRPRSATHRRHARRSRARDRHGRELRARTQTTSLEDAFVAVIGSDEGLLA